MSEISVLVVSFELSFIDLIRSALVNTPHDSSQTQIKLDFAHSTVEATEKLSKNFYNVLILQAINSSVITNIREHARSRHYVPILAVAQEVTEAFHRELVIKGASDVVPSDSVEFSRLKKAVLSAAARAERHREVRDGKIFSESIVDAIEAFVTILDNEGNVLAVNAPWGKTATGNPFVNPELKKGESYLHFCNGVSHRDSLTIYQGIKDVSSGRTRFFRCEYPIGADEVQWYVIRVTRFEKNGSSCVVVAHFEITRRKEAENALRKSEAKFRELAEQIPLGIWVVNRDGYTNYANPAMRALLEVDSIDDLRGVTFHKFFPKDSIEVITQERAKRYEGVTSSYEVSLITNKGNLKTVVVAGTLLDNDKLSIQGLVGTFVDITDRKKLENERQELDEQIQKAHKIESLGVLAGGIAHDFNNLLMGVLGNAELALTDLDFHNKARPKVERIQIAAQRAAELTNQLLAFAGKGSFNFQRIKLTELVKEMTSLLGTVISKKANITYDFPKEIPHIEVDPSQIRQVIMNLLTNASDALEGREGTISISLSTCYLDNDMKPEVVAPAEFKPGSFVCLEVSDTGKGMPKEVVAKMFDPFFSTKFTGRGLGLSSVLGTIRRHNGAISVDSIEEKGTTISVYFPVAGTEHTALIPDVAVVKEKIKQKGKILVVDDEDIVRDTTKAMLEGIGYEVYLASDGEEALEMFKRLGNKIDAIVLDLTMPKMGGEDALREIRKIKKDIPVILSSGFHEMTASKQFKSDAMVTFLQKPYGPKSLVEKITSLIGEVPIPEPFSWQI